MISETDAFDWYAELPSSFSFWWSSYEDHSRLVPVFAYFLATPLCLIGPSCRLQASALLSCISIIFLLRSVSVRCAISIVCDLLSTFVLFLFLSLFVVLFLLSFVTGFCPSFVLLWVGP